MKENKMKKHAFTHIERYAVWVSHDQICYICRKPLLLEDATCDHVIPEHLLEKPEELSSILKKYGLESDFEINDFNNWMPSHLRCNQEKGSKPFRDSPRIQLILDELIHDSEKVRDIARRFIKNSKKDLILTQLMSGLDSGTITQGDIEKLFPKGRPTEDEDVMTLYEQVCLHVDPQRWKLVGSSDIATVTDGKFRGITPVSQCPHNSWQCPYCGHYGPWNGTRCMTCGMMSDPND